MNAAIRSSGETHIALLPRLFHLLEIMEPLEIAMSDGPTDAAPPRATGSCLCGSVSFSLSGALQDVSYCHCLMCQRTLTHYGAYTACDPQALAIADPQRKLRWYRSSPEARRGFCARCGSHLFWDPTHGRHLSVSAGSLDQPTGLAPGRHVHLDHVADYDRDERHRPPADHGA